MSRIRKIGGALSERIAGDYEIYSEKSIVNKASQQMAQIGYDGGVKLGVPERKTIDSIIPKCTVSFRPGTDYPNNSHYGFDWMRTGDSGLVLDNHFREILGFYYDPKDTEKRTNDVKDTFKPNELLLIKKLCFFNGLLNVNGDSWLDGSATETVLDAIPVLSRITHKYCIPFLTLLPNKTASLQLMVNIEEEPSKLKLKFGDEKANEFLSINQTEISEIKKGEYTVSAELEITCTDSFSDAQYLYVYADDFICGALKILPNDQANIKDLEIYFIKVRTNLFNDSNLPYHLRAITSRVGKPVEGSETVFKENLQQALINPTFYSNYEIDCTGEDFHDFIDDSKSPRIIRLYDSSSKKVTAGDLRNLLEKKLAETYPDMPEDAMKVYFIDENCKKENFSYAGFAFPNTTFGVMFRGHRKSTVPHETMHALGLPHTFEGDRESAKFTYEQMRTHNIMDYSSDRFCTFGWQWEILNNKIRF